MHENTNNTLDTESQIEESGLPFILFFIKITIGFSINL